MSKERQLIAATRFGTGFHPAIAPARDAEGLVAELRAGARAPLIFAPAPRAERIADFREQRAAKRAGEEERSQQLSRAIRKQFRHETVGRVLQRALAVDGFFERLAAFWCDHFTVAAKGFPMLITVPGFEMEAIRPHITGRFVDMLKAAALDPAMIVYLDQHHSIGPNSRQGRRGERGLNENLAREILELHTLGAGGPYTQTDVTQFAELLTGYRVNIREGGTAFNPQAAEPGAETVLGRSYGGARPNPRDAVDFLEDLARHPATAAHLAQKLATHFVADNPPRDLVRHIEAAWTRSDGDLLAVATALVEHPAAWRPEREKIRQPQEIVAAAIRATGTVKDAFDLEDRRTIAGIAGALQRMNQPIFRPSGPDGWPEEAEAWITPQGLAARLDWAARAARVFADRGVDPRRYAQVALGAGLRDETAFLVGAAAERWEGIALALVSPEFNRR